MPLSQHPIPQNVTGFEFRLIGNLTLKQFAYLAFGGLFAWVFFSSPLPSFFKLPIAGLFAFFGFAFAFIPIQGRPLDRWLFAFFIAIIRPTQRIWKKEGEGIYFLEMSFASPVQLEEPRRRVQVSKRVLEKYLTKFALEETSLDRKVSGFLTSLNFGITLPAKVAQATVSAVRETLSKEEEKVQEKKETIKGFEERAFETSEETIVPLASNINFAEREVITLPSPTFRPTYLAGVGLVRPRKLSQRPDLASGLTLVRGEKRFELSEALAKKLGIAQEPQIPELKMPEIEEVLQFQTATPQVSVAKEADVVKEIEADLAKIQDQKEPVPQVSTPRKSGTKIARLTNVANVLQGLVHDEEGHLIENAIVVVKNDSGTPVRALKTNKLGQYLISTPLSSGRYAIEAEKEEYNFDILSFEARGEVIEPIEIVGKKALTDIRLQG